MFEFIKSDNGQASFSRLTGMLVVVSILFCSIYKCITAGLFPDIPPMWATLVAAMYGINKVFTGKQVLKAGGTTEVQEGKGE